MAQKKVSIRRTNEQSRKARIKVTQEKLISIFTVHKYVHIYVIFRC